jgi:uncharacterized membrane protein (UPF0127 family)
VLASFSCGEADSNEIVFTTAPLTIQTTGGILSLTVEIADTDEKREQGFMNRQTLASDAGMVFVFDEEASRSFWMKNTYVSLDMIFLSADKEIIYIEENTTPLSTELITPDVLAQYVLEVNAGYCAANGVAAGDVVAF